LNETLAVDASVVVVRCLSDEGWRPLDGYDIVSPPLAFSETSSVLHERAWRGVITIEEAADAHARLASAPVRVHVSTQILREAWDVADRLGWAKTYDAEYIALARRLGCRLLTIDERLRRSAGHLVEIIGPADL
jgi:predicted nucleic acid-binding protein